MLKIDNDTIDVNENKVIVLIMAYKQELSEYEKIALCQCVTVLKNHSIKIVKPQSIDLSGWSVNHASIKCECFKDEFFKDVGSYSRLLLSMDFYKRFKQFEYLLIYQLDAFIFRDELKAWCNKGYDYIGAPWFEGFSRFNENAPLAKTGNGGFSLRRIESHLKVLQSFSYLSPPKENWQKRMKDRPGGKKWLKEAGGFLMDLCIRNNTFWLLNSYMGFEDQFWSLVAAKNFTWFNMPEPEEAFNFSFEMQPRRLYELNNRRLPFGCHAWWKYDLEFWKPHIEKFGYRL